MKRDIPSNTSKKGSDNNDAATWNDPRFSPIRYMEWGRGIPDALQEGTTTPVSITMLVPRRQGFFPTPKKHTLDDL
jgi:hypothetical protein